MEKRLAEGESHRVPLNPGVKANLPREIETPRTVRAMQVDFDKAADLWAEAEQFVIREFAS